MSHYYSVRRTAFALTDVQARLKHMEEAVDSLSHTKSLLFALLLLSRNTLVLTFYRSLPRVLCSSIPFVHYHAPSSLSSKG